MEKMTITYLGHSCFIVEKDGFSVVFDPYAPGSVPGYRPVETEADLVLCSHGHGDHNFKEGVRLREGRENPFSVTALKTWHDEEEGRLRGENTIYVLESEGMKLAHFGDLGCMPTEEQMNFLRQTDVVLIPVGGFFTIDAATAGEIVKQLQPGIVIPMHYRGEGFGYDAIGEVENFLEGRKAVDYYGTGQLAVDKKTASQTAVLTPRLLL